MPEDSSLHGMPDTPRVGETPYFALPGVLFDETNLEIARHVATARLLAEGADDSAFDDSTRTPVVNQVLAEMAVQQLLDRSLVLCVLPDGQLASPVDVYGFQALVIPTDETGNNPDLVVPADRTPRADLFVSAHRETEYSIRVYGYASNEAVHSYPAKRLPGGRSGYIVPARELRRFPEPG